MSCGGCRDIAWQVYLEALHMKRNTNQKKYDSEIQRIQRKHTLLHFIKSRTWFWFDWMKQIAANWLDYKLDYKLCFLSVTAVDISIVFLSIEFLSIVFLSIVFLSIVFLSIVFLSVFSNIKRKAILMLYRVEKGDSDVERLHWKHAYLIPCCVCDMTHSYSWDQ